MKASMGFQHSVFVLMFKITFFNGVDCLISYSTMFLSEAQLPKRYVSIGLNFTLLMLSKPHVREHMGLVLCSSQMSTCWPQVAKTASFQWWSIPVYTVFPRIVWIGSSSSPYPGLSIFHCFTVLSSPTVKNDVPQKRAHMPRTKPSWACKARIHCRLVKFQILTSPSHAPDSTVDKLFGCLAMQLTPSLWPSSELRKGFANTRSSFVAFRALTYSRATSNGCSAGS